MKSHFQLRSKSDEKELIKENESLSKLIDLKKNSISTANTAVAPVTAPPTTTTKPSVSASKTSGLLNKINTKTVSSSTLFKNKLENNSRSEIPKDEFLLLKDCLCIFESQKIHVYSQSCSDYHVPLPFKLKNCRKLRDGILIKFEHAN